MPIEITELIVRAKVSPPEQPRENQTTGQDEANRSASQQQVEKAVSEVLDILKRKKER